MSKRFYEFLNKHQMKYPAWLFLWLVSKRWIYPEPRQFSNRVYISESVLMMSNSRTYATEVLERLIYETWEKLEENWKKCSYVPSWRDVTLTMDQDFESLAKAYTIRVTCFYKPNWRFGDLRSFVQEIEELIANPSKAR